MEATNKANMDAMMEKMNSLVAANKENTRQNETGKNKEKNPKQKKVLCPNCKCFVYHKPDRCYELEANKAKRYPGWKSILDTATTV